MKGSQTWHLTAGEGVLQCGEARPASETNSEDQARFFGKDCEATPGRGRHLTWWLLLSISGLGKNHSVAAVAAASFPLLSVFLLYCISVIHVPEKWWEHEHLEPPLPGALNPSKSKSQECKRACWAISHQLQLCHQYQPLQTFLITEL